MHSDSAVPDRAPPLQTVLFVCHHGAAKSVLAGSYFNRFAAQVGLETRAMARDVTPSAGRR